MGLSCTDPADGGGGGNDGIKPSSDGDAPSDDWPCIAAAAAASFCLRPAADALDGSRERLGVDDFLRRSLLEDDLLLRGFSRRRLDGLVLDEDELLPRAMAVLLGR